MKQFATSTYRKPRTIRQRQSDYHLGNLAQARHTEHAMLKRINDINRAILEGAKVTCPPVVSNETITLLSVVYRDSVFCVVRSRVCWTDTSGDDPQQYSHESTETRLLNFLDTISIEETGSGDQIAA